MKKKIAIIGSGISGLTAGFELSKKYEIHIYEKNSYLGGHTHTHKITENNKKYYIYEIRVAESKNGHILCVYI